MGSNNSKTNPGGAVEMPAKIRPLLRQRVEELRKRRGIRTQERALSKKQLLKEVEDDNNNNNNSHLSNENEIQTETTQPAVEKLSKVVPSPPSEYGGTKEKDHCHQEIQKIKSSSPWLQEGNKHEEANVRHDDDEDEDDIGRLIGPSRSPSFRIYCNEAEKKKEKGELNEKEKQTIEIEKHEKEITPILYQKSPSIESYESAASASASLNSTNSKEMERTPKRKGHKMKKLGAMKKNLLNVKNIQMNRMNRMMGCAGNGRRTLLADN